MSILESDVHNNGRLAARPTNAPWQSGSESHAIGSLEPLNFGSGVLLFNPVGRSAIPAPVLVMLHGAGGKPQSSLQIVQDEAQRRGVLVLAPKSSGATWDVLRGGFGPDVAAIDQALDHVFQEHNVDPTHVAIGGFSDGGSYALTLGLINGELFSDVLAFSPGFTAATTFTGRPKIYISHGRSDTVLPFARTGQRLAQELEAAHYNVRFDAFEGGHRVPPDKVAVAMDRWLTGPGAF